MFQKSAILVLQVNVLGCAIFIMLSARSQCKLIEHEKVNTMRGRIDFEKESVRYSKLCQSFAHNLFDFQVNNPSKFQVNISSTSPLYNLPDFQTWGHC